MNVLDGYAQGDIAKHETTYLNIEDVSGAAPKFFSTDEKQDLQIQINASSTSRQEAGAMMLRLTDSRDNITVQTMEYFDHEGAVHFNLKSANLSPKAFLNEVLSATKEACHIGGDEATINADHEEVCQLHIGRVDEGSFIAVAMKNKTRSSGPKPPAHHVVIQAKNRNTHG